MEFLTGKKLDILQKIAFEQAAYRYKCVLAKYDNDFNKSLSELCKRLSIISERVSRNRHTLTNIEKVYSEEEEKYLMSKLGLV